jgi:hypothetical protein
MPKNLILSSETFILVSKPTAQAEDLRESDPEEKILATGCKFDVLISSFRRDNDEILRANDPKDIQRQVE